ncbi:MAG: class I SAM-dependent rRNA methyltransferase [Candidatus Alcyoniella australis]|nr:class I SAM-dependent rRNA methyltransferase [Candidatus Alcyoniella australis]
MTNPQVVLKPDRDRSVKRRHPWVFSGAIKRAPADLEPGAVVDVVFADGGFVGRGTFNPNSQIQVRIFTFDDEPLNDEFIVQRVEQALKARSGLVGRDSDSYRLINSEGDGLPGLVVDRFNDYAVCQAHAIGAYRFRHTVARALVRQLDLRGVLLRSDTQFARSEGLSGKTEVLHGQAPDEPVTIRENDLPLAIDLLKGHKTGHYCDQRPNRRLMRELAAGRRVLDAFAYGGGFGLNALAGGATSVTFVESSKDICDAIRRNLRLGDHDESRAEVVCANVFDFLSSGSDRFDMVVLDPPAFARGKAQVKDAARGYKEINLKSMRRLDPGGVLATFSCSGHVNSDLFQKIVFGAALDAPAKLRIVSRLFAGPDHPTSLFCPEGDYLKGLLCQLP